MGGLSACHQNSGPTSSTSFETPTPPAQPLVVTKAEVAAATHVPSECPTFSGGYLQNGKLEYMIQEKNELGSTYVLGEGIFIADGRKHLGPDKVESTYVAECKGGELKVTISPVLQKDAGAEMTMLLKQITSDGDFKFTMVIKGKNEVEEVVFVNTTRSLPRAKHEAETCPVFSGVYSQGSSDLTFESAPLASAQEPKGRKYEIEKDLIIADGVQRVMSGSSGFDSYVASCDAGTLKIYFGKSGNFAAMSTMKLLEDGSVDSVFVDRSRGRTEAAVLKRQVEAAPAPIEKP